MSMCLLLRKVLKGYLFIQTMSVITFRYRQTKSEETPKKNAIIPNPKLEAALPFFVQNTNHP